MMKIRIILQILVLIVLAFFSVLMFRICIQYIPIQTDVAFLQIKQYVIKNSLWFSSFYLHVYVSFFVLLAGFTQFSKKLQLTKWHKRLGNLYVWNVLFFVAPSGLIMSFYANGKVTGILAFSFLSIAFWVTTFIGWKAAKKNNFVRHRDFMIRSYAFCLSAISLRLFKWILVRCIEIDPLTLYQIVAWLSILFNWFCAEIIIWRIKSKNHQ